MSKVKKWVTIVCTITIVIMAIKTFINEHHKYKMEQLANFAEEQFLAYDYNEYMNSLLHPGLSQLSAETEFFCDYEYGFDRDTNTLQINCSVTDFSSMDIDTYYTESCNSIDGQQLFLIMNHIANSSVRTFRYSSTQYGNAEINVKIRYPDSFSISSPEKAEFEYNYIEYDTGDLTYITVNHKWVYYQANRQPILTRDEFEQLSGTGYGGTVPHSWAETHLLQCLMVRCIECGYLTDNGGNTECDICRRIPDEYK